MQAGGDEAHVDRQREVQHTNTRLCKQGCVFVCRSATLFALAILEKSQAEPGPLAIDTGGIIVTRDGSEKDESTVSCAVQCSV